MPREFLRLLAGFRRFRERYFEAENSVYRKLSQGQSPKTLVIGCSDSRVDPAIIASASPGELFVVRNVANLVPPFEIGGGYHGVSSAIEFAVVNLKVENVVILGHRQCGGIRALVSGLRENSSSFIDRWMRIALAARERVFQAHPHADEDTLCVHCEKEAIKVSIANLKTFPFVQQAIQERGLNILGVYFDIESGDLLQIDSETAEFHPITVSSHGS
ncbi:MAG: carbonic anhydrase [Bdellovibrionales bacterium]